MTEPNQPGKLGCRAEEEDVGRRPTAGKLHAFRSLIRAKCRRDMDVLGADENQRLHARAGDQGAALTGQ